MNINRGIAKNLARTADFINTVNGGSVYPSFNTTKKSDHYRIEVSMPSVNPDNIKVEVTNNSLMIFQQVEINQVNLPNLLGLFKLSHDAVLDEITAEYGDNLLTVIIPKNEMTGGFHRNIKIHRPY